MFAGSVSRLLAKRAVIENGQAQLAAFMASAAFAELPAAKQAGYRGQAARAAGLVTAMNSRLRRKTGHA